MIQHVETRCVNTKQQIDDLPEDLRIDKCALWIFRLRVWHKIERIVIL